MKKKITALAGICALCLALGVGGLTPTERANASVEKRTVFTENFNAQTLSNAWASKDAESVAEYNAMRFNGGYYWGGAVALTTYTLQEYNKFTFDMRVVDYNVGDSWIALGYGGYSASSRFFDYAGYVQWNSRYASLLARDGADFALAAQETVSVYEKSADEAATITLEIIKTADETYDFVSLYEFADDTEQSFTWSGVKIPDSDRYICFNSANTVWDLVSFEAFDGAGASVFQDDFSADSLTEEAQSPSEGSWHISSAYSKAEISVCRVGTLAFNGKNSLLLRKEGLENTAQSNLVHALSFSLRFNGWAENAYFGIGFGLENENSAIDKKAYVGVTANGASGANFALIKAGEVKKSVSVSRADFAIGESGFCKAQIKLYYDYSVEIVVGNASARFENVNFEGAFALGNLTLSGEEAARVEIDDLSLLSQADVSYASPDASNNFFGIKRDDDGTEFYYVNPNEWFFGQGVSLPYRHAWDEESSVLFFNSTAYSSFGYRAKYDEFILRFEVEMTSKGRNGECFGMTFGKSTFLTNVEKSTSVGFFYNGYDVANVRTGIKGYNCLTADGSPEVELDGLHFWKDTSTRYQFTFIVRGRCVEVYCREKAADITGLGVLRARFVDVDTDGYVSVFGTGGVGFALYNYSIQNIGAGALENSAYPLRENFSSTVSGGLATQNGVVEKGALRLTEGSLSTTERAKYFLLQARVSTSSPVTVAFSDDEEITVDFAAKTATFKEGTNETTVGLPTDRNYGAFATIDVCALGNTARIGLRGEYEPTDKLYETAASHTFYEAFCVGATTLKGTLTADDFRWYVLDSYQTVKTDYSPSDGEVTAWQPKEKWTGGKTDFAPILIVAGIAVVAVAAGVTVVIIVKKRKGRKAE